MNIKKNLYFIILILVTFGVHFAYYGYPKQIVFDEIHFGKDVSGYFTNEYFFDIHPPLGMLLIAGMGYLGGFHPGFGFIAIGDAYPDNAYLWLRFLPTLAGTLLPIVIFFLSRRLGISKLGSFAAGIFVALENSLLVHSRFILYDAFLLLFGFSSLLAYLKFRDENKTIYLFLAGILATMSFSSKWTGAAFLGLIIVLEFFRLIKFRKEIPLFRSIIKSIIALFILPFMIYSAIFTIHLELLYKSGPGNDFVSENFQKTLQGSESAADPDIKASGLFDKFVELNIEMFEANARVPDDHPYVSKWYTWPLMKRPIFYWSNYGDEVSSRIYFLGDPIIWWLSSIAILCALLLWANKIILWLNKINIRAPLPGVVVLGYVFNFLPFAAITRVMFLYHYMAALVFSILALACLVDKIKFSKQIFSVLILVSVITFIYFSPLSYGLPITDKAYESRNWVSSWE